MTLVLRHDRLNEVTETSIPGLTGTDYPAGFGDGPFDFLWFKYDKMNIPPPAPAGPVAVPKVSKKVVSSSSAAAGTFCFRFYL